MKKRIKHNIRKLWRDRLLLGICGLMILSFSYLQFQIVLESRPVQPSWTIELSQAAKILTNNQQSEEEERKASSKILNIAEVHNLKLTTQLFQDLSRSKLQPHNLELEWVTAKTRKLRIPRKKQILSRAIEIAKTQKLIWVLEQSQHLESAQLVKISPDLTGKIYLVHILTADLEQTYGLNLPTSNNLEKLLENEAIRAHTFTQSGFLLATSLLILLGLLAIFFKLQNSSRLPRIAHLIVFIPEEYVAELGHLQRRLKKKNTCPWQIRQRLIHEFVFLLWVHCVQIQIENLFWFSTQDHTIDD